MFKFGAAQVDNSTTRPTTAMFRNIFGSHEFKDSDIEMVG